MAIEADLEDRLIDLVDAEAWDEIAEIVPELHPADIAEVLNRIPKDAVTRTFALIPDGAKPDVLAELEGVSTGTEILESLSTTEISDIVEEMAPDDAADVLGELPDALSEEVLDLMEKEDSDEVRRLLTYEDDTAGGIMTTDVVAMRESQTVQEALDAIAHLDAREPFYNANTVDDRGHLTGYVHIWDLLRERNRQKTLGDLRHLDFAAATVDMDQEEVAHLMSKYDLTVLPVVDMQGALVGRITADDIIDVMAEEASEDIFRLAGSDDAELESSSPLKSCFVRFPWLIITLVGGFATSVILEHFHAQISGALVLAAFVPIILAMGGNTGIQSSTLIVRSIALNTLKGQNILRLLLREVAAGALMGSVCGIIIGLWAMFMIARGGQGAAAHAGLLAAIVALALFSAMTFAAMFGALVPLVLNRLNIDPAVASGPFVTITNDIAALLIYFGVTVSLMQTLL